MYCITVPTDFDFKCQVNTHSIWTDEGTISYKKRNKKYKQNKWAIKNFFSFYCAAILETKRTADNAWDEFYSDFRYHELSDMHKML